MLQIMTFCDLSQKGLVINYWEEGYKMGALYLFRAKCLSDGLPVLAVCTGRKQKSQSKARGIDLSGKNDSKTNPLLGLQTKGVQTGTPSIQQACTSC